MSDGAQKLTPYLKGEASGEQLVGAVNKDTDYRGPEARISADGEWLNIVTDEYEGAAMLNIEALPQLRRALSRLAKHLRDTHKTPGPPEKPRRRYRRFLRGG